MASNLQQRLIASSISVPLAIAAVYFSQDPLLKIIFAFVIALLAGLGLKEMFAMEKGKKLDPKDSISIIFSIAYLVSLIYIPKLSDFILLVYVLATFLRFFQKGKEPLVNLSATFFAFLYITIPLSFLVKITELENGRIWLFYLLCTVKATDTAAFFIGKSFGKTLLAPIISPQKTWEGAIAGFFGAIFISALFTLVPGFPLTLPQNLMLGALISVAAQLGDLSESLLKRDAKVKDSSSLPGLGGVVDILDSLVFAAPLLYILIR